MSQINACFISYRHTGDDAADAFVRAFVDRLRTQVALYLPRVPLFFDEKGLKAGDLYSAELAEQLCRSACMVMFYLPLHFDVEYPYCAMEYRGMLELEQRRLGAGIADLRNRGLIFPVVFRGADVFPKEISSVRLFERFDDVLSPSEFKVRRNAARFETLARSIFQRYTALHNAGVFGNHDCSQFRFETVDKIKPWLQNISLLRTTMPGH